MSTSENHYHCFMGNGIDAVLIGPTGSMVEDRAQGDLDRCYWYKADRYYPEDRVIPISGRLPREGQPLYAEGGAWREIAPLGRTWYTVNHADLTLSLRATTQHFSPEEGILYSTIDYGAVQAEITTFLHAHLPLLVIHYTFTEPVTLRAYAASGPWIPEGYDTDPFNSFNVNPDQSTINYCLEDKLGSISLALEPPGTSGQSNNAIWREVTAQQFTQYFSIADEQDNASAPAITKEALARGYDALQTEHIAAWQAYATHSSISIPHPALNEIYRASLYHFKAAQNRISGGIPVNNLRLTWSSHVFWDAYFMHHALLAANRKHEALEGARFFLRTLDHAKRHAHADFNSPGLKWDWELTHTGQPAYGTWFHQKDQVHNNASYANIIWGYYEYTQDKSYLREFYPLLKGLAEFFIASVIEQTSRGYEVRALTDVTERVQKVRNEGLNLTGSIRILQIAAQSSEIVNTDKDFAAHCREVASGLIKTLDILYNGHFFQSAEGDDTLNFSSLAPIYPMMILPPNDPRCLSTAQAYLEAQNKEEPEGGTFSAWSTGILATVFAMQGDGETAWRLLEQTTVSMCNFGGMSEHTFANGHWNMQYFSTAQAAVCTAIQSLLLQTHLNEITIFPAVPASWPECSFDRLLAQGIEVTAHLDQTSNCATATLHNTTGETQHLLLRCGASIQSAEHIEITSGDIAQFTWNLA